jgi:hypothetical protein
VPGLVERIFAPIESRAWAAALSRDLGIALVGVAAVQGVLAWLRGPGAFVDAAVYAVSGIVLWVTPNRLAAAVAFATSAAALAIAVHDVFGSANPHGARSILLAFVTLWIGGRALAAALAHRRLSRLGAAAPGR